MNTLTLASAPYTVLGLAVGLLVGMTGVGGGSLMTPLLILLFGIHPVTAVGTDLLFAGITKSAGTLVNGLNKAVDWRLTGLLAAGSLPASAVTLFLLSKLDMQNQLANEIVRDTLFVTLLLTAFSLIARRPMTAMAHGRFQNITPRTRAALTVLTGVVVGVLVSMTSIGAGAVGIVALIMLYPQPPLARIIAADVAHAVPLTLLAGFGHWLMGSVNLSMLGALLIGSIPGIVIGSYASTRVPERVLRTVLSITLVVVAVKTVF